MIEPLNPEDCSNIDPRNFEATPEKLRKLLELTLSAEDQMIRSDPEKANGPEIEVATWCRNIQAVCREIHLTAALVPYLYGLNQTRELLQAIGALVTYIENAPDSLKSELSAILKYMPGEPICTPASVVIGWIEQAKSGNHPDERH